MKKKKKSKHLLFSCINNSTFFNFRDNFFVGPIDTFIFQTGFGNLLLSVIVIVNNGRILALDTRRQTVFVIVPKELQQIRISCFRWIEINWNDFDVIASVVKEQRILISTKLSTQFFFFFPQKVLTNFYNRDWLLCRPSIRLLFATHLLMHQTMHRLPKSSPCQM